MAKTPAQLAAEAKARLATSSSSTGSGTDPKAPIGGYFVTPEGQTTYQYDPSEFGAAAALPYGQGNPLVANVGPNQLGGFLQDNPAYGGLTPSRGTLFYSNEDLFTITGQLMNQGPEEVARIQQLLTDAGYLKGTYTQGQMDPETVSAFHDALELANYVGTDWEKALTVRKEQIKKPAGPKRAPLVLDLASPDDLKAMLQAGAQQIYGKFVSAEDVDKFVGMYQGQQAAAQTAAYQASGYDPTTGTPVGPVDETGRPAGTATTIVGPPTSSAGVNRQFEEQFAGAHPTEARTGVFASKLDEFLSAIHGPSLNVHA